LGHNISCKAAPTLGEDAHCVAGRVAQATTADQALLRFKELRAARAIRPSEIVGAAQIDMAGAAAETLQILGQIVVDRASAKAYDVLQSMLKDLLGCADPKKQAQFSSTCATLGTLRIQDIAMAPNVLFAALSQDIIRDVGLTKTNTTVALGGVISATIIPLLTKPTAFQTPAIQGVLDTIVSGVASNASVTGLPPAQKALALGVLAYVSCTATTASQNALAGCDFGAVIDKLDPGADDAKSAARALASHLISIATAGKVDLPHVQLAIDTLFATACMVEKAETVPTLTCPPVDTINDKPLTTVDVIAFTGAAVDAALALDGGRLIVVASRFLDLTLQGDEQLAKKRAMHLLGGLLDYAATYATPASSTSETSDKTPTSAHDQRTKILESLTKDMSDRTGREGADIISVGGSLRTIGGVRIGTTGIGGVSFYGPLSLTLGVAYTHIPKKENAIGIHVQIDAVDLGNYLALDNGATVKTPELGDAFAPSITIGFAYGHALPFILGATAAWTPQFAVDSSQPDRRGSFNIGITAGIHVPLIDLN